jgi:hypothetical protein
MEDIDLSAEEKVHSPSSESGVGFRKDIDVTIIEVDKQEKNYEYTIRAVVCILSYVFPRFFLFS